MIGFGTALRFVFIHLFCLFYTAKVLLHIAVRYLTEPRAEFWYVKKRPHPPPCLQNHDYGVSNYITVNDVKLHYVENGDPAKPLMLFIHGFPEFWFSWRYQLKEFSKDYWVIAVDMRGYGDSDKPKGLKSYRIENMVQDIKELVHELGREKFTLVAHDWGAVIGWDFVAKHMDMLEKYILMGAPSRKVLRELMMTDKEQLKMSWYTFFFQMPCIPEIYFRINDLEALYEVFRKHNEPNELEAYKYTFARKGALTEPINYYRANLTASLKTVQPPANVRHVPGLYLLGEHDAYISQKSGPLQKKELNNLEFLMVPKVCHFLQQADPVAVNSIMRQFLIQSEHNE